MWPTGFPPLGHFAGSAGGQIAASTYMVALALYQILGPLFLNIRGLFKQVVWLLHKTNPKEVVRTTQVTDLHLQCGG